MLTDILGTRIDPVTFRIIIAFILLLFGFALAKILDKTITYFFRRKFKTTLKKPFIAKLFFYGTIIIFIIFALAVLQANLTSEFFIALYSYTPNIISFVLMLILLGLFVRFISFIVTNFISKSGLSTLIEDSGKEEFLEFIISVFRLILYFFGFVLILNLAGIDAGWLISILSYVLYPLLILFLLLLLFGFKDLFANVVVGHYFRYSQLVRKGEYLRINNESVKINSLTPLGVVVEFKDKFQQLIPYKKILDEGLCFKQIKIELSTLEKIKKAFIAQHPSYCGPASVSMILKIFGFDISQEEIGREAKTIVPKTGEPGGSKPADLIKVVKKLTNDKVVGVWIDADKIVDLKNELKSWLHGEALIIVDYKKSYLFPSAAKAHYSVCISVEGDELLILDPSRKTGGVYYASHKRVFSGMNTFSELIGGKRGFIVFALDGTPAHQRIKEGLIYADQSTYKKITREIQDIIDDVYKKMPSIENVMPKQVKFFMKKTAESEKVARMWKPKKK
ncbi:MAG: C39 family peptidase [Nanoarchaeota archaeon]|nr:C39 family peptidase [Nanoarchaeota archaeon]MBU1269406.1 C39 family peptidase [Nanoarchaeota archaeon]MBU1604323.1 C39 family peptidase [Nanoarchaeota archaeon]MBU2442935.1 C39 family peptidase [Nanoarchaeota archaeon]